MTETTVEANSLHTRRRRLVKLIAATAGLIGSPFFHRLPGPMVVGAKPRDGGLGICGLFSCGVA
jgi:hypothetical protein